MSSVATLFPHNCLSNASVIITHRNQVLVVSHGFIPKGKEVTLSWSMVLADQELRRTSLKELHGIECEYGNSS